MEATARPQFPSFPSIPGFSSLVPAYQPIKNPALSAAAGFFKGVGSALLAIGKWSTRRTREFEA